MMPARFAVLAVLSAQVAVLPAFMSAAHAGPALPASLCPRDAPKGSVSDPNRTSTSALLILVHGGGSGGGGGGGGAGGGSGGGGGGCGGGSSGGGGSAGGSA